MRKTPISHTRSFEEWISLGIWSQRKITAKPQQPSIGRLPKEPDADHHS